MIEKSHKKYPIPIHMWCEKTTILELQAYKTA